MSKPSDNKDNRLSKTNNNVRDLLEKRRQVSGKTNRTQTMTPKSSDAVEVAKSHSPKDIILWVLAFTALIGATLVNYKLPGIWQPANDIWVRMGLITALVIFALVCLALTHQGSSFKVLLSDARIELRRVAWPTKNETIQYTWQTLVVIGIVAALVWLLDNFFNWWVGLFIG